MKSKKHGIGEDIICIDNGYKPSSLHSWGPGVRDIYALHYVIAGKGYFESNHVTYTIKAGESFIIFPDTEVYYYPDSNEPWEYIWIDFKGDEALRLLSMTNFSPQLPLAPVSPINMEPLFHIIETTANRNFYEIERSNAKLRILLSYYMENNPRKNTTLQADYVLLTKEYIKNNYWKSTLTVANIAAAIKIERTYLFRLFKDAAGVSILSYLTAYRMKRACELLKSSDLSIKSVACSVGYLDQMYFSKVFKKYTSSSPTEYRKV